MDSREAAVGSGLSLPFEGHVPPRGAEEAFFVSDVRVERVRRVRAPGLQGEVARRQFPDPGTGNWGLATPHPQPRDLGCYARGGTG